MRPILFKAKRTDNQEWVEGNYEKIYDGSTYISYWVSECVEEETNLWEPVCKNYEVDPNTVCQFTGLYDKEGKMIWEGDVLKNIGVITFSDGCFFAGGVPIAVSASHRVVAGSIHDNPEY